jgi:V/A-type H+-transporting ATPase subunit C
VRGLVAIDIDSYNVLSLMRAKLWDLPPSQTRDLIVEPIFDVPSKALRGLINAANIAEALKHLAVTTYRRIIPSGISEEEIIPRLEAGFELIGYKEALKTFLWQIYGLGVVLGIVKLRELEVRNLSAIAFGVEQAIGLHNIMPKLVILA